MNSFRFKTAGLVFLISTVLLMATNTLWASGGKSSGMPYLLMGPSAHNLGISDGHTAALTGASAIYINPSMMAMDPQSNAVLSYMVWPATDTQNSFAGVVFRRGNDALGFGLLSSLVDDIPFRRNPSTEPDGMFAVRYLSLASSYARRIGPLSIGITGMYLYEQFFQQDASGYGLSAGAGLQMLDERMRVGLSLRNLGSMQELNEVATRLPTLLSVGSEVQLLQFSTTALEEDIPLLISVVADYNVPLNDLKESTEAARKQEDAYVNAGLELTVAQLIDLRAGVRTGDTQRRFSFGAGLHINELYFNYAMIPFQTGFGIAHAVSLQYRF